MTESTVEGSGEVNLSSRTPRAALSEDNRGEFFRRRPNLPLACCADAFYVFSKYSRMNITVA